MKRILSLCLGVALLFSLTAGMTRAASGPFADVPTDHWAYQSVDTLQQAGIVIGYPDGTYGGRRAMTRYEFAVAIARLLPLIKPIDTSQFATKSDIADMATKTDLDALSSDLNAKLAANSAAIDALRALCVEFRAELDKLNVDVPSALKRLDALEARVSALETEQRRVKITADINVIAESKINTDKHDIDPIDQNGYYFGGFNPSNDTDNNATSLWDQVNVFNDVLITIDGRVSDDAHAIVKIDAGNYLSSLVDASGFANGTDERPDGDTAFRSNYNIAGPDVFAIYNAYLDWPVSLGPLANAEAVVGRFPEQFTKYTFMSINPDVYTSLDQTDSGNFIEDGAKLAFNISKLHVQAFAASNPNSGISNSDVSADNTSGYLDEVANEFDISAGPEYEALDGGLRPGFEGRGGDEWITNTVDQNAGARVTFGVASDWTIGLTGWLGRVNELNGGIAPPVDPSNGKEYDEVGVYGADVQGVLPFFKKENITFNGEYSTSTTGQFSNFGNLDCNNDNHAIEATLGYAGGAFAISGGYQSVDRYFAAPGYWGRIGDWTNPTNIEGGIVDASYVFTPKLTLTADGNFYQGRQAQLDEVGLAVSPLDSGDKLTRYQAGLKYALTSKYSVDLGYEWVQWDLSKNHNDLLLNTGEPTEQYITLGVGHDFSKNSSVKVMYQIVNYDDNNTGFGGTTSVDDKTVSAGDSHGGIAVTQFDYKF